MHFTWSSSIMVSLVTRVAIESPNYYFLEQDIMKHKIMFEVRKVRGKEQQIKFSGHPFVILGNNLLDCTHGVNHHLSKKENVSKKTIEGKVTKINC